MAPTSSVWFPKANTRGRWQSQRVNLTTRAGTGMPRLHSPGRAAAPAVAPAAAPAAAEGTSPVPASAAMVLDSVTRILTPMFAVGVMDEPASAWNGQTAAHRPLLAVPPPTVDMQDRVRPHPQFLANCSVLDTPTPRGGGSDGDAVSMVMMRRHDESASARNGQTVAHRPLWGVVSLLLSSSAHTVLSPVSGSAACTVSACRREAG